MEETKTCYDCKQELPAKENFYRRGNHHYSSKCKKCHIAYSVAYRKQVREDNYFQHVVYSKKGPSGRKGIPYNITAEYIEEVWNQQKGICPVLGLALDLHEHRHAVNKATLDRIIPRLGYVKGNVAWISSLANRVKTDCTDPEVFLKVAEYVRETNLQEQPEFDFSFTN